MKKKRPLRQLKRLASNGLRIEMDVEVEAPSLGEFYEILEFRF